MKYTIVIIIRDACKKINLVISLLYVQYLINIWLTLALFINVQQVQQKKNSCIELLNYIPRENKSMQERNS